MTNVSLKERYTKETIPAFKGRSVMAVPRLEKVVVNVGVGRARDEKEREDVRKALVQITGQAVQGRPARIAIASFKSRKGMTVGFRVTLRGKRMWDFLDRLVLSAIPRTRDFRGLKEEGLDEHGNMHIGIREHIIFPEMIGEDVRRIFSLQVSIVTTAGSRERAKILFTTLGFPLAKD
ncbi:MAG: 50S ribosomal protein L5 [Patescibacteria group bacterium]